LIKYNNVDVSSLFSSKMVAVFASLSHKFYMVDHPRIIKFQTYRHACLLT